MYSFSSSRGCYLIDEEGNEFLDLISGIAVSNVGHRHPKVVKAIVEQLDAGMHQMVYGEYIIQPQLRFAEKLASMLPDSLNAVYPLSSGSEAIEGALKLCKKATGRSKFVAMRNAYHGSTSGALSLMDNSYYSAPFKPLLPEVYFMDYNDRSQVELIDEQTAGVFIEPIQGESGYQVADTQFLQALRERCDETGALLVFDEIQSGAGRSGKFLAAEHSEVTPDILCLAKGIGGGMPISCFVASKQLMDQLSDQPILGHITTFGGHPVSAAAAHATLEILEDEKLMEGVAQKEQLFREKLDHPSIRSIRGKGLMLAVELSSFEEVERCIRLCYQAGVITDWFLYADHCLRLSPPLIITEEEIVMVCDVISKSLN